VRAHTVVARIFGPARKSLRLFCRPELRRMFCDQSGGKFVPVVPRYDRRRRSSIECVLIDFASSVWKNLLAPLGVLMSGSYPKAIRNGLFVLKTRDLFQ